MGQMHDLFMNMWELDFQFGLFGKDYFQGLAAQNIISAADYKKITGEDYVAQPANN